jgi:hypothetical protein
METATPERSVSLGLQRNAIDADILGGCPRVVLAYGQNIHTRSFAQSKMKDHDRHGRRGRAFATCQPCGFVLRACPAQEVIRDALHRRRDDRIKTLLAAVHKSGIVAVDGSSTGT